MECSLLHALMAYAWCAYPEVVAYTTTHSEMCSVLPFIIYYYAPTALFSHDTSYQTYLATDKRVLKFGSLAKRRGSARLKFRWAARCQLLLVRMRKIAY